MKRLLCFAVAVAIVGACSGSPTSPRARSAPTTRSNDELTCPAGWEVVSRDGVEVCVPPDSLGQNGYNGPNTGTSTRPRLP